ncbi:MAG: hypothetical protein A3H69_02745 [Candidatus Sungbacteria bacterium RIFCSPLOWO2_02_FULL_47_9]|nr:MAG: hypothetical protein A3H69_02745 [Candidatus Sungbacteria bacterium RIFCSPLOWO2_02_FULL_47_9]
MGKNTLHTLDELIFGHVLVNKLFPMKTYALMADDEGNVKESEPLTLVVPIPLAKPYCTKHNRKTKLCGCVPFDCRCI